MQNHEEKKGKQKKLSIYFSERVELIMILKMKNNIAYRASSSLRAAATRGLEWVLVGCWSSARILDFSSE